MPALRAGEVSPGATIQFNRVLGPDAEVLSCGDKKVPQETLPDDWVPALVSSLRSPASLETQGLPSMASPFGGVVLHWSPTFFRLTPACFRALGVRRQHIHVLTPNARVPHAPLRAYSSPSSSTRLRQTGD